MRSNGRELWWALAAILAITALYLLIATNAGVTPPSGELIGHGIGVLGFVLMLMTETLYSLRKRMRVARWGRISSWLRFHIFTGLVGPYMVLLHAAFHYNGLAGVAMLMTVIVVASGVLGRYIYTAIPRTADGMEMEAGEVEAAIAETEAQLQTLLQTRPQVAAAIATRSAGQPALADGLTTTTTGPVGATGWNLDQTLTGRLRWRLERRSWDAETREQTQQLERMVAKRQALKRQISTLARARQAMSVWHAAHIPLGLALFTVAFVHAGAALYYVTLMR